MVHIEESYWSDPITLGWIKSVVIVLACYLVSRLTPMKRLNGCLRRKVEERRKPLSIFQGD